MTQLRNALRAHLSAGLGPSEALGALGRFFAAQEPDVFATVLCVEFDPVSRRLIWASAGHPAPIIVDRSCNSIHLQGAPTPPIGCGPGRPQNPHEHLVDLGARLLMFSDGLIERRSVDLDIGLTHLMFLAEQTNSVGPPAEVCDMILSEMLSQAHDDDVCLLIADFGRGADAGSLTGQRIAGRRSSK
jgi:serine phosphatase RsbU (regulator of sigma subunit)